MTTQREIDEQIQKDYNALYLRPYDGEIALPIDLIERYKRALMGIAPSTHQTHASRMKEMITKPMNELTWVEVGAIINIIQSVPFKEMYDSIEEALEKVQYLEIFRVGYNNTIAALDKKMVIKKKKLMEISGLAKGALISIPGQA